MHQMKTLREFTDPILAGIAQSFLKDNEIDAVLLDEGSSAWVAARFLVPVRMAVPFDQEDSARELLKQIETDF